MHEYEVVNVDTWKRKTQFIWFNSFINPTYGMDVELDVTKLVEFTKKTCTSFFINFLYIITISLNSIEEFRLRYVNNEVRLYKAIIPTYTVKCVDGTFNNAKNDFVTDYKEFYKKAKHSVEEAKENTNHSETYNDSSFYDEFYFSCLPTLNFISMTHPIPYGDKSSMSVPRALWGKYHLENGKYLMMLNLTLSHALCDGLPLAEGFNKIQKMIDNIEQYLK